MSPQTTISSRFRLELEIAGICLFHWAGDRKRINLYMPDARKRPSQSKTPRHPDSQVAVPHVGYLRFDLRNLANETTGVDAATRADDDTPAYEVVHRFEREELHLDLLPDGGFPGADGPIGGALDVPNFNEFAPVMEPIPQLNNSKPPAVVLMRSTLLGGEFNTVHDEVEWRIPGDLSNTGRGVRRKIGGEVLWSRELEGDGIMLRLAQFGGGGEVRIPL
ncbi:MAG TPA: hypothetical protein VF541_03145, partial [Longimicrobium sp.]